MEVSSLPLKVRTVMVTVQGWGQRSKITIVGRAAWHVGCSKHRLMLMSIVFCFCFFFGGGGCHFSPTTLSIKGLFKNSLFVKMQSLGDVLGMWPSES